MLKHLGDALDKGLGKLFGSIILFPIILINIWLLNKLGFFSWADFPELTWRQMVVMAVIAAYIST